MAERSRLRKALIFGVSGMLLDAPNIPNSASFVQAQHFRVGPESWPDLKARG